MTKRTTVYLDPSLHKALKFKSAQSNVSISNLINHALKLSLNEDVHDLESIDQRKKEKSRPFENVLRDLKRDGLL